MTILQSLAFGFHATTLEYSATLSEEQILQSQQSRLKDLVEYAKGHSAFYSERFAHIDTGHFDITDLPITNKQEIMENFERVLTVDDVTREGVEEYFEDESNLGKLYLNKYVLSHTSGSQGQPLLIVQTPDDMELLFALQASRGNHESMGIVEGVKRLMTPVRLAMVTLQPGFYPSATAFEFMPEGMRSFVELRRLSVTDKDLVAKLAEFRPTHLTAYASILHEIAREVEEGHLSLAPDLEQVVNVSERLTSNSRARYEELFGAPILDDYGMGECLFLTNGCPASPGMHVNADWAVFEVVDENNRPVPTGQKGAKVLITNLSNRVQPFIRYEVGDVVVMATEPCGCGSNMPLIERIEGRAADTFKVPSGDGTRTLSPMLFQHVAESILATREYQVVQTSPTRFRLLLEPLNGSQIDTDRARQQLGEHLQKNGVDEGLELEVEVVDRLVSEGDSKFKRIVPYHPEEE